MSIKGIGKYLLQHGAALHTSVAGIGDLNWPAQDELVNVSGDELQKAYEK